jgi:type IV pilus assembly protein PilB
MLNRTTAIKKMEELGMDLEDVTRVRALLSRAYGIFLLTGPSGSGKTTTMYSLLSELKSDSRNIMTIEDPVEFRLEWMRQSELREQKEFTYDVALRSILRQDPDVLMVGEIRDPSTAEHAIRAALFGRVVCSTIHANSVVGTVARLIEMGIDRSIIAYALNGIINQRLVRRICTKCKTEDNKADTLLAKEFGIDLKTQKVYKGTGCEVCRGSGYLGRVGIFSTAVFDDNMRSMIIQRATLNDLQEAALKNGMETLKFDAISKITDGLISLEEAVKVI